MTFFQQTKSKHRKCQPCPIILKIEIGSVQLHYWKVKETSTFKSKIVFGLLIATSTWASIEKPSVSMTNCWEKQTIKTIIFIRHAAIMPFACMMMREEKPLKARRLHFRQDCYFTWLIRKMTRKVWCNIIKNLTKVQKIN